MAARTIFLAVDGRHITLGSGAVALLDATLAGIRVQGLVGWRVTLSGSLHGRRVPGLTRHEALGGATDADWPAAAAELLGGRR